MKFGANIDKCRYVYTLYYFGMIPKIIYCRPKALRPEAKVL
jgi:hypothetical protein